MQSPSDSGVVADLTHGLPRQSVICDKAAQPLAGSVGRATGAPPLQVDLNRIRDTNAWLTLPKIEADPDYAELMNGVLDELEHSMIGQ